MNLVSVVKRSAFLLCGASPEEPHDPANDPHAHRVDKKLGYAWILMKRDDYQPSPTRIVEAWRQLEDDMSFVIGGVARLEHNSAAVFLGAVQQPDVLDVSVTPFYMDRFAVTNADFLAFVEARACDMLPLWPDDIVPYLPQFTDSTGQPGPKFWQHGRPITRTATHPVVGIN